MTAEMWPARDYLPELIEHDRRAFPSIERLETALPGLRIHGHLREQDSLDIGLRLVRAELS